MRKTIKIFLASSIVEFANERMMIENFIRNISDQFEEKYDVKIQPLLCENFDDAYSKTRKQEEYNEKIRNSELCFFIFFTRVGEYTREEFEVARKKFEESGKPKIYTYFKIIHNENVEQSLTNFMDELDKTFGHYYGQFDHIDTIKLRILLSLKFQEMDFVEIGSSNGQCVIDGTPMLNLQNVSEFANNSVLLQLQEELVKVEETYVNLRPLFEKGDCSDSFYMNYSQVLTKRQTLLKEIEELQNQIFKVSLKMIKDDIHGEITIRQKEAYRLFELGDYSGCLTVLNSKDIDDDFFRERTKLKEMNRQICKKYISEHKTAIDILKTMTEYENRFSEIENRYSKILPVIIDEGIELFILHEYASFCLDMDQYEKGIFYALKSIKMQQDDCMYRGVMEHFDYQLLGDLYYYSNKDEDALRAYKKALQCMVDDGCEETIFPHDYIECYHNICKMFLANHLAIEKGEVISLLEKICSIYLLEKDSLPESYSNYFIEANIELGYIYDISENYDKVQSMVDAVDMSEVRHLTDLYKNIYIYLCTKTADIYYDISDYIKANNYIEKALNLGEACGLTQNYYVLYAWLQLADIYEHTARTSEAQKIYNNVMGVLNTISFDKIDESYADMFLFVYDCISDENSTINFLELEKRKKQILKSFSKFEN